MVKKALFQALPLFIIGLVVITGGLLLGKIFLVIIGGLNLVVAVLFYLLLAKTGIGDVHCAAAEGDLNKIKKLLEADPKKVREKDRSGRTPLHYAASWGKTEAVELLLGMGAEINGPDNKIFTPLHYAAQHNRQETIKLLIDRGANVKSSTDDGWTPLHWAVKSGYLETAQLLINSGADVSVRDENSWTLLHWAVAEGHQKIANLLIEKGLAVNVKDEFTKRTPLHLAALFGRKEAVKLLLEKSADVNELDKEGKTALSYAQEKNFQELAELLTRWQRLSK